MDSQDWIDRAVDVVDSSDLTHKEAAEGIGIGTRTWRRWRNGQRSPTKRTLRSLKRWVQEQTEHEGYSGPADAEEDPQAVAAQEMQDYGTGDYGRPEPPSDPDINGATGDTDFDPEQAIEEQARRFRQKHRRAQKKKRQTIRFDTGPVMIAMMGDQHIGNAGTDVKRIFDEQQTVLNTPGAYCWQMGDIVDNFIVGRLKEQNMKPSAPVWEQWQLAQEYFNRWGDRIVAFCGGNHGAWTMSESQVDYRRDVCPGGILYDGDDIRATVSVGSAEYDIWARHKWSGSSIYNPTHGMERAMRFNDPDNDIYVGAHTHEGSMFREVIHEGKRKAAIQIGSYKIHDDYAREQGFPPSDGSTACALILHDDGSFHGMADLDAAKRYMQALYN
jgi:hypothetical protein